MMLKMIMGDAPQSLCFLFCGDKGLELAAGGVLCGE